MPISFVLFPANRAAEVKEMWQVRQKELELDGSLKRTLREKGSCDRSHRDGNPSGSSRRHPVVDTSTSASASCSNTREYEHCPEGLRDEELEDFLHSKYYCFLLASSVLCLWL